MAALALGVSASSPAGEPQPPASPKFRPPRARVLFATDFTGDSLGELTTDRPGVWSVRKGILCGRLPDLKQQRAFAHVGEEDWADYAVDLDVCMTRGVDKGVVVRVADGDGIGVDLRGPGYNDVLLQRGIWLLGRARVRNRNGVWHHLRVEAAGQRYRLFVNGTRVLEATGRQGSRARGGIALPAYTGGAGECTVYYDNVIVTALE